MAVTVEDLKAMPDAELETLRTNVDAEVSRRAVIGNAEAALSDLNQKVLAAKGVRFGAAWASPSGAHDAYSKGWEVVHGGKTWVSLVNANVHEPGTSGWREKTATGVAPWVQPAGAHDAYKMGARVSFQGGVWESVIDGNVWSPGAHPAGWRRV